MKKIVSAALVAAILTSCSAKTKTDVVNAGKQFIQCAEQDLGVDTGGSGSATGVSLLDQVLGIIYNGGATWEADLATLAVSFGGDAIACAAQVAEQLFRDATAGSGSGSAATPTTSDVAAAQTPHDRALKALATFSQGKKFK